MVTKMSNGSNGRHSRILSSLMTLARNVLRIFVQFSERSFELQWYKTLSSSASPLQQLVERSSPARGPGICDDLRSKEWIRFGATLPTNAAGSSRASRHGNHWKVLIGQTNARATQIQGLTRASGLLCRGLAGCNRCLAWKRKAPATQNVVDSFAAWL